MLLYLYLFFCTISLHLSGAELPSPEINLQLNNNVMLVVKQGNIIEANCQSIVNAANEDLYYGTGVCGAIFDAAGRKCLTECCNKVPAGSGGIRCQTGSAVKTESCDLAKKGILHIIHAVGPQFRSYTDLSEQNELLKSAYTKSLELARDSQIPSIAFPLLSAGAYQYPLEDACYTALTAITEFANSSAPHPLPNTICMMLFSKEHYDAFSSSMKEILEQKTKTDGPNYMDLADNDTLILNIVVKKSKEISEMRHKFKSITPVSIFNRLKTFFSGIFFHKTSGSDSK